MGIKKKMSAIIGHIYCAMCGEAISVPLNLSEEEKREIQKSNKTIKREVMCVHCGEKTEAHIGKDNIRLEELDIEP